ncbi:MAG: DUF3387 domain-containing protein, partial [Chloroflexota bacterium]|nr:DUF3387 domain-containing protein [Chloroflexota bacterium]
MPVRDKSELLLALSEAAAEVRAWCSGCGFSLARIDSAHGWDKLHLLDEAVEAILENDDAKRQFLALSARVNILYKAILPDPAATEYQPVRALLEVLSEKILHLGPPPDISGVMEQVFQLLDRSVAAEAYIIK